VPFERPERGDEALQRVRAQVVDDEMDPACSPVTTSDALEGSSEVGPGSFRSGVRQPSPGLRLHDAEDRGRALALVLVIDPGWLARPHRAAFARITAEHHRPLVETDHRLRWVREARVESEHVLHALDVLPVDRGHAPHFFPATA